VTKKPKQLGTSLRSVLVVSNVTTLPPKARVSVIIYLLRGTTFCSN